MATRRRRENGRNSKAILVGRTSGRDRAFRPRARCPVTRTARSVAGGAHPRSRLRGWGADRKDRKDGSEPCGGGCRRRHGRRGAGERPRCTGDGWAEAHPSPMSSTRCSRTRRCIGCVTRKQCWQASIGRSSVVAALSPRWAATTRGISLLQTPIAGSSKARGSGSRRSLFFGGRGFCQPASKPGWIPLPKIFSVP